jgi:hypothetical protein
MHTVPPATRRQACVFGAIRQSRKRTQPEEQNQKNGEATPHLHIMLPDTERTRADDDKRVTMIGSWLKGNKQIEPRAAEGIRLTPDDY